MFVDPRLPTATIQKVFPQRLVPLWLRALNRPELDFKRQAAQAFALAHQRGMTGLEPAVDPLLHTLDQSEQNVSVRLACAQALIALDARKAAEKLFAHSQTDGTDMRDLVEPELARWDFVPARVVWLDRLQHPKGPGRGWILAIQALAKVRETKAIPRLRELALSTSVDSISRLESARALGTLQTNGLEPDAARLIASKSDTKSLDQLAAASMLRHHRGSEAAKILAQLAVEAEPAAAAVALDALLEDDPKRIIPLLPRVLSSRDAAVRERGIEAFRHQPDVAYLEAVAERMDDPHPLVRISARKALAQTAQKAEFHQPVITQATRLLAGSRWRALEQAALLLAILDEKNSATRLVQLLRFERPEVFVAAAWSLRKLAVAETLKAQTEEIAKRFQESKRISDPHLHAMINLEMTQLNQSVGISRFTPAGPVLRKFIPKTIHTGSESRSSALWGLGYIYEKSPPPDLVEALIDRVGDDNSIDPEDPLVRRMGAIALGRMKARDGIDTLKKYYSGEPAMEVFPNACGWAIEQITGEKLAPPGVIKAVQVGWFLEPID